MKFRPCIDLHQGQVKQIVGATLTTDDNDNTVTTNFVSTHNAAHYAEMYRRDQLTGGHVIMLGPHNNNEVAARQALQAWPHGLQIGGGITDANAATWLQRGASHVIVTSFVFVNGIIHYDRLQRLVDAVGGKQHVVLDLSCRQRRRQRRQGDNDNDHENNTAPYYVVTNQWQTYTDVPVNADTLQSLAAYCDEFLVHGVDVEGQQAGILTDLVQLLGQCSPLPVTYAGGVRSIDDLDLVERLGQGQVDVTVGSALDIFGGPLPYQDVVRWHRLRNPVEQEE